VSGGRVRGTVAGAVVAVALTLHGAAGAAAVQALPTAGVGALGPSAVDAATVHPGSTATRGNGTGARVSLAVEPATATSAPAPTGTTSVVPLSSPRVPNRLVIYVVYLLALVVVSGVVVWAALGTRADRSRIDAQELT
jgi:hypothetical protein